VIPQIPNGLFASVSQTLLKHSLPSVATASISPVQQEFDPYPGSAGALAVELNDLLFETVHSHRDYFI
jgi:hypothetical protein